MVTLVRPPENKVAHRTRLVRADQINDGFRHHRSLAAVPARNSIAMMATDEVVALNEWVGLSRTVNPADFAPPSADGMSGISTKPK